MYSTLSDQIVQDLAGDIGQTEITAAIAIRQLSMLDAEQIENRRVNIVYVNGLIDGLEAEIVGGAVNGPPFTAPPASHMVNPNGL